MLLFYAYPIRTKKTYVLFSIFQYLMIFGGLGLCGYAGFETYKTMQLPVSLKGKKNSSSEDNIDNTKQKIRVNTVQAAMQSTAA